MKIQKFPIRRGSGFTLIELLVVIMIIGVLAGLSFGALTAVKKIAEKTRAKNDVKQIELAISNYFHDYNKYPLPKSGSDIDLETSQTFMAILMGEDKQRNPRETVYINPKPANEQMKGGVISPTGGAGELVDSWGQPFQLRIDGNYDDKLENPETTSEIKILHAGVLVWSRGADQDGEGEGAQAAGGEKVDYWKDSIKSWE